MKRIAAIVLLFGLLFPTLSRSQGETSNWYFGNGAGITFNDNGSVTPLTDGQIDTFEGCATISDSFGGLLFYTDGITVYDRAHNILENGQGLYGDPSSTQSAIIVPKPGDPAIFFIFTVDTSTFEGDVDRGLNYSVVDMALNNGNGAVTQKNIALLADCSEKIAAVVKDCSDQSIWILTLASANGNLPVFDTYHAFEINTTGVITPSVKSTFADIDIEDARGYLKIAPDGKKMASANVKDGLFIYDFDAISGVVSNQQYIDISGPSSMPYGVEFSPNSQFLYIHASNDNFEQTGNNSTLLQYDVLAPNIKQSLEVLDNRAVFRGALQLGANGKIYRTTANTYFEGTPFLSVINAPNRKGAASNYQHEAIALAGKNATQGLPPFIQSFFNKVGLVVNHDGTASSSLEICAGENFTLEGENIPGGIYAWEKDGVPLSNIENVLNVPLATVEDAGKYRLSITTSNPADCPIIGEALLTVAPLPKVNLAVLEQCDIDTNTTDGITLFNLEQATQDQGFNFAFYENEQDQANDIPISNPEKYTNSQPFTQTLYYSVSNELGCRNFGELIVLVNPNTIPLGTQSSILICDDNADDDVLEGTFDLEEIRRNQYRNLDVTFYDDPTNAALEENPLNGIFTSGSTTIYARIENDNQCQGVEMMILEVHPLPEITLESFYQVCTDGEPITIDAPDGFDSYSWYKVNEQSIEIIGENQQIIIYNEGSYILEIGVNYQNGGQAINCTSIADFEVTPSNRAIFDDITITDFSENNSIAAVASGDGNYEYSLDGVYFQDEALFENVSPGFYTIFARDKKGCGITEEELAVIGFPKFFTPNGDGANDFWQLIGVNEDMIQGNVTIYNRFGKLIKQIRVADHGWDGTLDGSPLPASDYWFKVAVDGRKQFRGHFALKR